MKTINLTTTEIDYMTVTGSNCEVYGTVYDNNEPIFKGSILNVSFDDLPPQVRNNLNNAMKHLSREFNKAQANEDSETWVSK